MPRVNSRAECKPVRDPWQDDVNGSIIGGEDEHGGESRYRFYTQGGALIHYSDTWFADDTEAVAWCKATYPAQFKAGVEMRCYFD